jgi:chemotaxis regulatin CheY-phosphate phosphatase CheZ
MGGTRSSGGTTASESVVGSLEWGKSVNLSWLVEGLAAAQTPNDIGKLTRRVNKALDENIDRRDGWRIGTVRQVIDDAKERLAASRYVSPTSTSARRIDRYLTDVERSKRR